MYVVILKSPVRKSRSYNDGFTLEVHAQPRSVQVQKCLWEIEILGQIGYVSAISFAMSSKDNKQQQIEVIYTRERKEAKYRL